MSNATRYAELNAKKGRRRKKEVDPELPSEYVLTVVEGVAMIPTNFYPDVSPSALTEDWARLTLKFRPYFKLHTESEVTGRVDPDHCTADQNHANRQAWLNEQTHDILGKEFSAFMRKGWNEGLKALMLGDGEPAVAAASTSDVSTTSLVDFSFLGKTPTSQVDVEKFLFCDEVSIMVKQERYDEVFAAVYKWCYYLTMEGSSSNWATIAIDKYIMRKKFKLSLGTASAMTEGITTGTKGKKVGSKTHSWVRMGKKIASGSFLEGIRQKTESAWGVRLLVFNRVEGHVADDRTMEVDIGPWLPSKVKKDMTRKDGTRFLIRFAKPVKVAEMLDMKVGSLVRWCVRNNVSKGSVEHVLNKKFGGEGEETAHELGGEKPEGKEGGTPKKSGGGESVSTRAVSTTLESSPAGRSPLDSSPTRTSPRKPPRPAMGYNERSMRETMEKMERFLGKKDADVGGKVSRVLVLELMPFMILCIFLISII